MRKCTTSLSSMLASVYRIFWFWLQRITPPTKNKSGISDVHGDVVSAIRQTHNLRYSKIYTNKIIVSIFISKFCNNKKRRISSCPSFAQLSLFSFPCPPSQLLFTLSLSPFHSLSHSFLSLAIILFLSFFYRSPFLSFFLNISALSFFPSFFLNVSVLSFFLSFFLSFLMYQFFLSFLLS